MVVIGAEPEAAAAADDSQIDEHEWEKGYQYDEEDHYENEARYKSDVVDHAAGDWCLLFCGPILNCLGICLSFDDIVRGSLSGGHCCL